MHTAMHCNEWSENDVMAMAFVVEHPFGITSFRTPRHLEINSITDWARHLAYLCYQTSSTPSAAIHQRHTAKHRIHHLHQQLHQPHIAASPNSLPYIQTTTTNTAINFKRTKPHPNMHQLLQKYHGQRANCTSHQISTLQRTTVHSSWCE